MSRPVIVTAAAVTAALALALGACGDDDAARRAAERVASAAAPPAGDPARYCELVVRLDRAGETHFEALGQDAGPADYEAAERSFVRDQAPLLDELEAVAPAEIAADVRVLLAAQRLRGGLPVARRVSQEQASRAESRIKAYERRRCA